MTLSNDQIRLRRFTQRNFDLGVGRYLAQMSRRSGTIKNHDTTGRFKDSSIYFIRNARAKAIKIGRSVDPERRLGELQVGSPDQLELCALLPEKYGLEAALHQHFGASHLFGEWFGETPELITFMGEVSLWQRA